MSKVSEYDFSGNEIKRKLRVDEYVLEIAGSDIFDVDVIYSLDFLKSSVYEDGEKVDNVCESLISICLNGKDRDGNLAWISFCVNTNISFLNSLSNAPVDVSQYLMESEAFIKRPSDELSGFLEFNLPTNTDQDIYKKLSSFYVLKLKENEFIMKLCIPDEVFTYFKIIF